MVAVAIMAALLAAHWWCLDKPPYVEQAVGLWTEANYLIDSGFNYRKLRFDELHVEVGGPRTYVCSALPTLLALLMLVSDSVVATIWIAHVVTFVCAAIVGAAIWSWVTPELGRLRTALLLAAMYTLPLVAAQVEMVGLDMPMASASMPFFALIRRRRWSAAAVASWLAFAMKPSAFLLPLALLIYLMFVIAARWLARRTAIDRALLFGAVAALASFLGQFAVMWAADNLHGRVRPLADIALWLSSSPEIIGYLLITIAGTIWLIFRQLARASMPAQANFATQLAELLESDSLLMVAWFVVGGTVAAAAGTYYESRHLLLVAPLLALIAGRLLAVVPGFRWQVVLSTVLVILHVGNRNGDWYPALPLRDARGWGVPERSLEYRRDHLSNIDAVRRLERDHAGEALLVCEHFTHFVSLPRLGYALRSLTGPRPYRFAADDTELWRLFTDQPAELIVVRVESQLGALPFPAYAIPLPGPDDDLLDDDGLWPRRLVYRKRFNRDAPAAARLRQYVDFLYSQATELDAVGRLLVVGDLPMARRLAALENGWSEDDSRVPGELSSRLARLEEQLATSKLAGAGEDAAAFTARQRLQELVAQRRPELAAGQPLAPLDWGQRSVTSTLAQRILSVPASPAGN
jgi:hypothetical protein